MRKPLVFLLAVLFLAVSVSPSFATNWYVLVYMDARNHLGNERIDLWAVKGMVRGSQNNKSVKVVVDWIRKNGEKYAVIYDGNGRFYNPVAKANIGKFVRWAFSPSVVGNFRFQRTMLVLWGTGSSAFFSKLPDTYRKLVKSVQSGLSSAGRGKFDLVLVDACGGYSLPALYNMPDIADYMVASDNRLPNKSFYYDTIIRNLPLFSSAKKLSIALAKFFINKHRNEHVSCNAVDLISAKAAVALLLNDLCTDNGLSFGEMLKEIKKNFEKNNPNSRIINPNSPCSSMKVSFKDLPSFAGKSGYVNSLVADAGQVASSVLWSGSTAKNMPLYLHEYPLLWIPLLGCEPAIREYASNFTPYSKCLERAFTEVSKRSFLDYLRPSSASGAGCVKQKMITKRLKWEMEQVRQQILHLVPQRIDNFTTQQQSKP